MVHAYDYRKLLDELEQNELEDITPEQKTQQLEQLHSMMDDNLEFEDQERIEMQILRLSAVPDEEAETLGPEPIKVRVLLDELESKDLEDITQEYKITMLEQLHTMMEEALEFNDYERLEYQILRLAAVQEEEEESLGPENSKNVHTLLQELENNSLDEATQEFKTTKLEQLHCAMDDNLEFDVQERLEDQIVRLNAASYEETENSESKPKQ